MIKKIFYIPLVLSLIILSGCAEDDITLDTSDSINLTETSTSSEEPAEEDSDTTDSSSNSTESDESSTANGILYLVSSTAGKIYRYNDISSLTDESEPDITITSTHFDRPKFVVFNDETDTLYVSNEQANNVLIFENLSSLEGEITPDRILTSEYFDQVTYVALDKENDELYVVNMALGSSMSGTSEGSIVVFENASTVNGEVIPNRTITSDPEFFSPHGIAIDTKSNTLYVADTNNCKVKIFDKASTLNGKHSPDRVLHNPKASNLTECSEDDKLMSQPIDFQILPETDTLILGTRDGNSMFIYDCENGDDCASTIDGFTPPTREISGDNTTLYNAHQIYYHQERDEFYVANLFDKTFLIFRDFSKLDGDVSPDVTITVDDGEERICGVAVDLTR